jgi:ankyrin repeat protein
MSQRNTMELKVALWKIEPREVVDYINLYRNNEKVIFDPKKSKKIVDKFFMGKNYSQQQSVEILQILFANFHDEKMQNLVNIFLRDHPNSILDFINQQYLFKDVALLVATAYNSQKIAQLMLENNANINVCDRDGWTPLITSMIYARDRMFGFLVGRGANINTSGKKYGVTAFMVASLLGDLEKIILLYNKGAKINKRMFDGNTALSLAKKAGHENIVSYLKAIGATI